MTGRIFPMQTDAWTRYGRRAYYWDKGTSALATGDEFQIGWEMTPRVVGQQDEYAWERLKIDGVYVQSLFAADAEPGSQIGNVGRKDGRLFPIEKGNAGRRIATVQILRDYRTEHDALLYYHTVPPGLSPVEVYPDHIAERGTARVGINVFAGATGQWLDPETKTRKYVKGFLAGYLPETTAGQRLYDVLYLHDPARLPGSRPPSSYLGNLRLGMPHYHAQLSVQVAGRRTLWQFGRFVYGCLSASDQKPLAMVCDAVEIAKSERDKVLLETGIHRPPQTGDYIRTTDGISTGDLVSAIR